MQRYNTSAVILWWLFSYWETPSPRRILPAHVSFFHKGIYLNCFLQKTREHKHKHKGKRIWRSFIVLNFHESIKQSYYFLECFSVTFFPRKVFSFLVTPFFCKQLNFCVQYHFWVQNFWKDSSTVSSDYLFIVSDYSKVTSPKISYFWLPPPSYHFLSLIFPKYFKQPPPLVTNQKVKQYLLPEKYPRKFILGSMACISIPQYPAPDFPF